MNPSETNIESICHECFCKDQIISNYRKSLDEKDNLITEKTAAITGYQQMLKKMTSERTELNKREKQAEKFKDVMAEKTKEVEVLRAEVKTKDDIIAILQNEAEEIRVDQSENGEEEVIIEEQVVAKNCKKCKFTASSMQGLQLHMENDHQENQFECEQCNKKFSFQNQLKLHRRHDHEEGSFACFVCNNRLRTHKDLKLHMQRRCKSQNQRALRDLPRLVNEDISPEDEFRCTKCDQ